jgi:hypothetical protein
VIAVAASVVLCGCAGPMTRERVLEQRAAGHVYSVPLPIVWTQVERLLTQKEFEIASSEGTGPRRTVRTKWATALDGGRAAFMYRYVISATEVPGGCAVEAIRVERTINGYADTHPSASRTDRSPVSRSEGVGGFGSGQPLLANPDVVKRDRGLEWELLRKVEPEKAARIEREVDRTFAARHDQPAAR